MVTTEDYLRRSVLFQRLRCGPHQPLSTFTRGASSQMGSRRTVFGDRSTYSVAS